MSETPVAFELRSRSGAVIARTYDAGEVDRLLDVHPTAQLDLALYRDGEWRTVKRAQRVSV